jgi:prepilin-type N-terminal cleavage/methylation domain-containing protein
MHKHALFEHPSLVRQNSGAFTLIELLVVIAIIAILAVVVVLTLNPAGLLQESRDSNRLSDMATLNSAIGISLADSPSESLGLTDTLYASVPDPTATSTAGDQCQGLGMPSLPSGWSWHCAASSTFRRADVTGWVPVNLSQNTFGSPLAQLPVDPVNATSSRLFYIYATDGQHYELTTPFESAKFRLGGSGDQVSGDGGTLATLYERGSKLGIMPLDYGDPSLVGYWAFDEGQGAVVSDWSGSNASGSWSGSGPHWASGKVGNFAGRFATTTGDFVNMGHVNSLIVGLGSLTVTTWFQTSATGVFDELLMDYKNFSSNSAGYSLEVRDSGVELRIANGTVQTGASAACPTCNNGAWHQAVGVIDRNAGNLLIYIDGAPASSLPFTTSWDLTPAGAQVFNLGGYSGSLPNLLGSLDDVRIYNRVLSAAEIQALYNAKK